MLFTPDAATAQIKQSPQFQQILDRCGISRNQRINEAADLRIEQYK